MQIKTVAGIATTIAFAFALTACGGTTNAPEVVAAPSAEESSSVPSPEPTPEPTPEAAGGSRDNPLKKGEARKVSDQSAFTVSFGKTEAHGDCIAAPITAEVDWKNLEQQYKDLGEDTTDMSSTPFFDLRVSYVTKDGKTYDAGTGDGCVDAFMELGEKANIAVEIYTPTESATNYEIIQVPEAERKGGVWVAENSHGERVFGANY